jgi:hypothetical protein
VFVVAIFLPSAIAIGCSREQTPETSAPTTSAAADERTALQADREWVAALEAGDAVAAGALLDAEFEWTNAEGLTRGGPESVETLAALLADLQGETDVETYDYGRVSVITSTRPEARMMRVWALRPGGWRALSVISTALATGTTPFAAAGSEVAGDCDNPCRTMPYTPTTETEETLAGLFQQLKVDEWHPNVERPAPYVLDGVDYVTATAQLSKEARVAHLTELEEAGEPSAPGDPVVSMQIVDLGDAAVMRARHTTYRGGVPYYSVRVWALRDGRWQLANTQQTVIE